MLRELADIGMEMARALQGEVRARAEAVEEAGEAPRGVAELGLAFSRVARAVRQTLALEARLEDDRLERERAAEDSEARWTSEIQDAARVRAAIARAVGNVDDEPDDAEREDLTDGPDVGRGEGFVADRPAADVVAGVCADLGLEPDLSLWTAKDSAAVTAARGAGVAGSARIEATASATAAAIAPPGSDRPRGRPP